MMSSCFLTIRRSSQCILVFVIIIIIIIIIWYLQTFIYLCHIDSIFPCKTFIRRCVETPFLVRKSLSCSLSNEWIFRFCHTLLVKLILQRVINGWELVCYLWSYHRVAVTEIVWICSMSVIKFAMKNSVSHPSVSAKVSAGRVGLVTHLSLIEFQAIGAELENLSHKNTMYPP